MNRHLSEVGARLDVDGAHENAGLSGGTKFLQSSLEEPACTPDGRLAVVLRIGCARATRSHNAFQHSAS